MSKFKINRKKFNRYFWIIFASPFVILTILLVLAATGGLGDMPDIETLENPQISLASQVISEDGEILGSFYYQNQNRTNVDYDEVPSYVIDALIATEDIRFYRHAGIDAKSLVRVAVKTILLQQRSSGGGSTITQQLAKLLFHDPPRNMLGRIRQKIKEWIIAVRLEKAYAKEEIIIMYFNQCDFLNQAVGIKSAAQVYFSTLPDSLTIEQGAMLVGMAKNPSYYNPADSTKKERVMLRRNVVLNQMEKYGYISRELNDSLKNIPIELKFQRISHNQGLATYFREFIRKIMNANEPRRGDYGDYLTYQEDSARWVDDPLYGWCNKNKKPDGNPYNLYTDGLKIYSTVNSIMQEYAEQAVIQHLTTAIQPAFFDEKKKSSRAPFSSDLTSEQVQDILWRGIVLSDRGRKLRDQGATQSEIYEVFNEPVSIQIFSWNGTVDTIMTPLDSIRYYKHFIHSGFMAMDPESGEVKAYVGGINYSDFQYDHVTQGKRQVGSTFKPFLYILAMQEGYNPCDKVLNVEQSFILPNDTVPYRPRSLSKPEDLNTWKTLKWGLATSENNISAWLVKQFGPKPIADIAHKMGIISYIDPVPAMVYGTSDVSVAEMVSSFATFANKGVHTEPVYVSRIEDKNGNVLAEFMPRRLEAISEETAYLMLNLMEGVTDFGTAIRLRYRYNFSARIAAKTGTTQNHSDGWFIGVTPRLVAGTWVGAEDRSVHFDRMDLGQGANLALPIWALFMEKVYADSSNLKIYQTDEFEAPPNMAPIPNCDDFTSGSSGAYDYYWETEW
ncbi:MAG: transglycosylase domain-containing protein [Bacteroidales bacterium]|nr:transglycosylase domain-containing protein [Bacteroidales bacterium]